MARSRCRRPRLCETGEALNAIPAPDRYQELREALRALCAGFDGAYWRKLDAEERYPESEKLQREVLAKCRRVFGPDHPSTAISLYNVADVLYEEHRYAEAVPILQEAADIERRVLGVSHPDTVDSIYKLARLFVLTRNKDEAIAWLRDAVNHGLAEESLADLEKGTDWKLLRGDPRFEALIAEAQKRGAATAQKTN